MQDSEIYGIGIDQVEIERIAEAVENQPRFSERILTIKENEIYETYRSKRRRAEFLAGRFAVKEAFSKAIGTGIGKNLSFQDVECLKNEKGSPYISSSPFQGQVYVSITHTAELATAMVLLS